MICDDLNFEEEGLELKGEDPTAACTMRTRLEKLIDFFESTQNC